MNTQVATFAGGCFWCIEAAFNQLTGVLSATSGYMGGHTTNPSYRDICTGQTGHAEVVQLQFDASIISYRQLLEILFFLHDPTTLNRQGNDVGTQYRSAVFVHDEQQQAEVQQLIAELTQQQVYPAAIVTSIEAVATFYPAEQYHQGYAAQNPNQPYCQFLVLPKLAKFRQQFAAILK
ncbi:peptide-methionine (S)-S-oxide reductase [Rheinheimera riviphila]|uniref:Peptide methionine sulfoxide reductase MsrA n=1 Tax=Rheinheimera riviphila TaxID=1834037 RepID=A0A437QRV1_9GAMM|nr:peptide-methionine (S)-S-oxide reductase MsrA [Rheinheimera riviphila]RVU37212.1 peptide-methionine (S)-S-oxide reductase [Rheinheimera riviphila]